MKYYVISFFLIVLTSCGTEEQHTVIEESEILQETVIVEDEAAEIVEDKMIESRYQYDKEWEVFKEAIINKDIKGVSAFASSDAIDAEELIKAMNNDSFLKILKTTTYNDLIVNETEFGVSIEFHATDDNIDEDGETGGSTIVISFTEGEQFLELDYFLFAG